MFGSLGLPEILVILAIVAILFGGKKIPTLMKGLGEGIVSFKDALKKGKDEKKALDSENHKQDEKEN